MRILVPVDNQAYSANVVRQVAELASNTWSNITFLCVGPDEAVDDMAKLLYSYRTEFFDRFHDADLLYGGRASEYQLIKESRGVLSLDFSDQNGRKALDLRIRTGTPSREILLEAEAIDADLIVIGCSAVDGCRWPSDDDVPGKNVKGASCPVFVIKENMQPQRIVCCLDHDTVTQASIELINQLVTLYHTDLELIGVTDVDDGLRSDVDRRMARILAYYSSRNISSWVRLVDAPSLKTFIEQSAVNNLVAVWTGKHSFLDKIFSRQHIEDLATTAASSVLILR